MFPDHHVIVVPGLGNEVSKHIWATKDWSKFGVTPHVFDAKWKIEEPDLQPKLNEAFKLIDDLHRKGGLISLVGNSAGSSFVLNLFAERKNKIHRVVINCGRVRTGDWPWFTFDQATASSPSFRQSVLRAKNVERNFSQKDRQKILTLRAMFDELVPPSTVPIKGARNIVSPSIEHMLTIALNMTLYKKEVLQFILED